MAIDKSHLKDRVQNGGAPAKRRPEDTIAVLLERNKTRFANALPAQIPVERFMSVALTTLRRTPKLLQCEPRSLMSALVQAAELGCYPGPLGEAYLVPYGSEATFILGYQGMLSIIRRSGEVESVMVEPVHENDEFSYELGLEPHLRHKPALRDRGDVILYYGIVRFRGGGYQMRVVGLDEIEAHRQRSRSGNAGPWKTDYDAMCRKTVVRIMFPWLPKASEQMQQAAEAIQADTEREYGSWDASPATDSSDADVPDDDVIDAEPAGEQAPPPEPPTDGKTPF